MGRGYSLQWQDNLRDYLGFCHNHRCFLGICLELVDVQINTEREKWGFMFDFSPSISDSFGQCCQREAYYSIITFIRVYGAVISCHSNTIAMCLSNKPKPTNRVIKSLSYIVWKQAPQHNLSMITKLAFWAVSICLYLIHSPSNPSCLHISPDVF